MCMLACEMLRPAERRRPMRFFDVWESLTDRVGRQFKFSFKISVSDSCTVSRSWSRDCLAESLSFVGRTCRLPVSTSFIFPEEKEERPTESCSILQPRISDKTNSRIESIYISQCIHGRPHLLASQMRLYDLQRPLKVQPEVDLL